MTEFKRSKGKIYLPGPEDEICYALYDENDDVIVLNTVFVDEKYRGTGQKFGERVMEEMINYAKSVDKKIDPVCSYAKHYRDKYEPDDVFI